MAKPDSKKAIRFISYFGYAVFIGYIMLWGSSIQHRLRHITATTFNSVPELLFTVAFPLLMGILIALPRFIANAKNKGEWKIDWAKLLGVGLPAFYIATYPIIYFVVLPRTLGNAMFSSYTHFIALNMSYMLHTVSGVVLGYLILSVIHKEKSK